MRLRPATVGDAAALARVEVAAMWHAHGERLPHAWLDERDVESTRAAWAEALASSSVLVACTDDDRVFGLAARSGHQLDWLAVDPAAQGAGLGRTLLVAARTAMADEGVAEAAAWAYADDGHARGLLESDGWTLAEGPSEVTWAPVAVVRYARALP